MTSNSAPQAPSVVDLERDAKPGVKQMLIVGHISSQLKFYIVSKFIFEFAKQDNLLKIDYQRMYRLQ